VSNGAGDTKGRFRDISCGTNEVLAREMPTSDDRRHGEASARASAKIQTENLSNISVGPHRLFSLVGSQIRRVALVKNRRFGGMYSLNYKGVKNQRTRNNVISNYLVPSWLIFHPDYGGARFL
jgi:hypothetical protein